MERFQRQSSLTSSSHPSHPAYGASSLGNHRPSQEQKGLMYQTTTTNKRGQDPSLTPSSSTVKAVSGSSRSTMFLQPKSKHRPGLSHHPQQEHQPGTRMVLKMEPSCSTTSPTSALRDTTIQQRISAGSSLGTVIRDGKKDKEKSETLRNLALRAQADDGSPTATGKHDQSMPHHHQQHQQHDHSLSAIENATSGTNDTSVAIPVHSDAVTNVQPSSFHEMEASQEIMNKASPWSTPPRTPTANAESKIVPLRSTPVNRRSLMERQCSEITMSDWSDSAHSMGSDQHHRRRHCHRQQHHNSPSGTPGPSSKATTAARGVVPRQRSRRWKSIQQRSFRDLASFESLDECWYDDYHDDDDDDDDHNEDGYVDDEQQELLGLDEAAFLDGLASSSQDELADSSEERFLASSGLRATAPALGNGKLMANSSPPASCPSTTSPRTLTGSRPAMMTSTSPLATNGTDAIRRRSLERLQLSLEPPLRSPSPRGILEESQPSTEEENNQRAHPPQPSTEPCSTSNMRATYFKKTGSLPLHSSSVSMEDWTESQDIRISAHSGHSSFSSYFGGVQEQEAREAVRFDGPMKRPTRKLSPPRFRVASMSDFQERYSDETIYPQEDSDIASLVLEIVDAGDSSNLTVPMISDQPKNRCRSYMQSTMTSPSLPPHASDDPMSLRSRWDHNEVSADKMNGLRFAGHTSHASFFADAVEHDDSPIRVPARKPSPYPPLARDTGEEDPISSGRQDPNKMGKVSLTTSRGALQIPLRKLSLHSTSGQDASTTSRSRSVEEEGQARETSDSTFDSVTPPPPPLKFQPISKQVGDTPTTIRPCCSSPIGLDRPKKPERKLSSVPRSFSSPVDAGPQGKWSTATHTSLLLLKEQQHEQHAKASPKSVMDISSIQAQRARSLDGFVNPSPSTGIH